MKVRFYYFCFYLDFTSFLLIVEKDCDNQVTRQSVENQSVEDEGVFEKDKDSNDCLSEHGQYSALNIHLLFKDMKDNQTDLTLDVGGRKKTYSVTFDPDDNLSDHKQVSKGNLIKRVYSGEEAKTKWREKLFGYDVYWGYNAVTKKEGYICPAMICKNDGASTGLVLKRILRTRCATPKLWMLVYSIADDQCYIIREHIVSWMKKDTKEGTNRDWWTNPNIEFDQEKCSKWVPLR